MEADLKGYVVGSGPDLRGAQDVSISAGATGLLNVTVRNPDLSPFDLTGATLTFTVTNASGATVYTATVTLNSPNSGGTGFVSLASGATSGLGPSSGFVPVAYRHVITLTNGSLTNYQLYPPSRFVVSTSAGTAVAPPFVNGNDTRLAPLPGAVGSIIYDTGIAYASLAPASSGTLHTNGAAPPSWGAVSGADFAAQSPASVFSGPASGGSVAPGFRALVATDLPTVGTPGTYGDATAAFIGQVITDAYGRITGLITNAASWANVKDFGAKGDGSTNDTAAIQAAADSLRDTGGVVFFPRGTYIIMRPGVHLQGTALHPYNNVVFLGVGAASVLKAGQTIGTNNGVAPLAMLYFDGQANFSMTNVGIKSLRLSGFDIGTLAGPLLLFSRTNGGFMIDSFMDTTSTEGAYWNSPTSDTNGICIGNQASQIGGYGVSPANGPLSAYNVNTNNALIINNYADSCGLAIEAVGSGAVIANNQFSNIAQGVALTPSTAMSLESTFPGTRYLVANNTLSHVGTGISMSSISSTQGNHLITGNVFENVDTGITLVNSAPVTISNNQFYDTQTSGAGSSAIIDHASTSTAPIFVENNRFIAGPTGTWAYALLERDAVRNSIVRNNIAHGNGWNAAVFATSHASTGWNTQFIENIIVAAGMANSVARYDWQVQTFTKTVFAGIDNGTIISTLRPSIVRMAAAPTVGTWSVGDIAINSAPTATSNTSWLCTAAGTPGTWTPQYGVMQAGSGLAISGNTLSANLAAANLPTLIGASSIASGTQGAAPQPTAGQQNLFLRGDATWAAAGGGGSTPLTLFSSVAVVSSVTTGTIDGISYSMPGGTMTADGQSLVWVFGCLHAATVNAASVAGTFNGASLSNTASSVSADSIQATYRIVRLSSTTARVVTYTQRFNAGATSFTSTLVTGINWTNPIVIKNTITGATANGDIATEFMRVEWWP